MEKLKSLLGHFGEVEVMLNEFWLSPSSVTVEGDTVLIRERDGRVIEFHASEYIFVFSYSPETGDAILAVTG